jgi:urease accessory protein
VFLGSERVVLDSLLLDPCDGPLDSPHRLGRFNCLALILIVGEPLSAFAAAVLEARAGERIVPLASVLCSASPLRSGALIRIAGEHVEEVARELHQSLGFLPDLLGDDPWARKY